MANRNQVELKREPLNYYDRDKIVLYYCKKTIGYIPSDDDKILATLMGNRCKL